VLNDEFRYKGWRIEALYGNTGWEALIYRPSSLLHEAEVPDGPTRHTVIEQAKAIIDKLLRSRFGRSIFRFYNLSISLFGQAARR
jgi:hypothetical protein